MTKKLEQLFDLPPSTPAVDEPLPALPALSESAETIRALDNTIDKIDQALPAVRGLDATDTEMDELAAMATTSYKDLMDLGMQVDSRSASEIFGVASSMLGHAITAKTAKLDKKLKMIDLQLKKMRLDQNQPDNPDQPQTGTGHVLSRNELLEKILAGTRQKGANE